MRSEAETVAAYLTELPDERRQALEAVRRIILEHLPEGYEEVINWGMITYQVPIERYPDTYNGKPLMYAALASQKHHIALYLTGIYVDETSRDAFEHAYRATGKRYDAGKSCVRFKAVDDLPLALIGESIAAWDVETFIARVHEARAARKSRRKR